MKVFRYNLLVLAIGFFTIHISNAARKFDSRSTSKDKDSKQPEYKLVEDMQIKSPLESGSKLNRKISRLVCRW